MTRAQRRLHGLLWPVLLPALLAGLYFVLRDRPGPPAPRAPEARTPEAPSGTAEVAP